MKPAKIKDPNIESIKSTVLGAILSLISISFLFVAILLKNIFLIILASALIVFFIILCISFFDPINALIRNVKRIEKKRKELTNKVSKTAFEELFVMYCNNQKDVFVNDYLKTIKNKRVKTIKN